MTDTVDVVLPARQCSLTLEDIVSEFSAHPAIGRIIVVSNPPDLMHEAILRAYPSVVHIQCMADGKGQAVKRGLERVITPSVVLCDADILNLTQDHISTLICEAVLDEDAMVVGVCDPPDNLSERRLWSWPWVSGERCVPTRLLQPLQLHGYLMETQINYAASYAKLPIRFEWLKGCISPYRMSEERIAAMVRDGTWGKEHGILP